jgi:chromosome segregation ATPase
MHDPTGGVTSTQPSSGGTTIVGQVSALQTELTRLEQSISQRKTRLEQDKSVQSVLKSDIAALGRAAADLARLREDAGKASAHAREQADSFKQAITDDLDDGLEQQLLEALDKIDQELFAQADAVQASSDELRDLQAAQLQKRVAVQQAREILDEATAALRSLPADLSMAVKALQKLVNELRDAANSGQNRRSFILMREVYLLADQVETLTGSAEEQKRVEHFNAKFKALDDANQELTDADTALVNQQAQLTKAQSDYETSRKQRAERLKQLSTSTAGSQQAAQAAAK